VAEARKQSRCAIYAQTKVASVRSLHRTSLPIPYAKGVYPAKEPHHILGGLLTLDSGWSPPFGDAFRKALNANQADGRLDLGCVAAHGHFLRDDQRGDYEFFEEGRPATAFLFNLISQLQFCGTVPMIDVQAYAKWLVR